MNIVLGISGSIAAYKAADLASQLVKQGHEVHVVMTRSATEFITPLTLQTLTRQPVLVSLEDEKQSWKPGHIDLANRARIPTVFGSAEFAEAKGFGAPELGLQTLGKLARFVGAD